MGLVLRGDTAAVAVRGFTPAALAPGRSRGDSSAGRGGGMFATVRAARGEKGGSGLCVGAGPRRLEGAAQGRRGGALGGPGLELLHALCKLLVALRQRGNLVVIHSKTTNTNMDGG